MIPVFRLVEEKKHHKYHNKINPEKRLKKELITWAARENFMGKHIWDLIYEKF